MTDQDQFVLFEDDDRRQRMKEIYEAAERWDRRVAHLAVCTVTPWWDSPPDCKCQERTP